MLSDTSPEAERVYYRRLAELTPAQRIQIALELCGAADDMLRAAIARRFPGVSDEEFRYQLVRTRYGSGLANRMFRR